MSVSKNWKNYNQQIPDDRYYYARSCIRQNFFPGSEKTFLTILQDLLGKDIYDDPKHTSCTGIAYHSDIIPFETMMTVIARQFSLMTEAGYKNLVPSCVTSFGLYNEVLETWEHHPEVETKIREMLWKSTRREFEKPEAIMHASDIIYHFRDTISDHAQNPLINVQTGEPLKVVDHIGCHYAKIFPSKGIGGAEFPVVLSGMVSSWGGQSVDYPERRHCCGFGFRQYLVKANRGYSIANSYRKFESMAPYKPDFIVANCPGCAMFLDRWQYTIGEMKNEWFGADGQGIPVLTYEEMAGLVLGFDPWAIGLQMHQIDCEPLLKKMGISYDSDKKFSLKRKTILLNVLEEEIQ